jgi:hypothetical protein
MGNDPESRYQSVILLRHFPRRGGRTIEAIVNKRAIARIDNP